MIEDLIRVRVITRTFSAAHMRAETIRETVKMLTPAQFMALIPEDERDMGEWETWASDKHHVTYVWTV